MARQKKKRKGENWGGAREGAGAPEKHPLLRRQRVYPALPFWLIEKLMDLPGSQGKEIEKALCQVHGWQAPIIVENKER